MFCKILRIEEKNWEKIGGVENLVRSDFGRISPGAKFLNQSENIKSPRSAKNDLNDPGSRKSPGFTDKKILTGFWGCEKSKSRGREISFGARSLVDWFPTWNGHELRRAKKTKFPNPGKKPG